MVRVFLRLKDKPFARELHRRLARNDVTFCFDEESIEWGDHFVTKLEKGIDPLRSRLKELQFPSRTTS